ncbi:MAG: hypothetical protein EPO40_03265 [Myxococcaceae bacterium]|nr:MAG: hypothetical protein EPO40_03265 [Myxococcaceae bacterium]
MKCGQPGSTTLRKTLHWHPEWVGLTILLSPLVYVIVASALRKSEPVAVPLCPTHAVKHRRALITAWGVAAASLVLLGCTFVEIASAGGGEVVGAAFVASLLGLLAAPLVGIAGTRLLRPVFIDDRIVRVTGAGPGFLGGLSPSPWPPG